MNEGWAFVWFPLIFWASKELISKEKWKYVCWLALGWGSLLLTHNIMAFIFAPFFLAWLLYWLAVERKLNFKKKDLWLKLTTSGLWALGLAAFFTIPLLFEKKFTQIESMFSGYFDWHIHFATINQLFISRFWGYGPSTWGVEDKMPFPVGHLHWILSLIVALITIFSLFEKFVLKRKIKLKPQIWLLIGLFGFGLFYVFLAHQRSTFIWERVRLLQLAQFPWRLLVGAAFAFSLLVGSIWQLVKNKVVIILLVLGVIVLNWSYFKPESMGPLPDEQKFSGIAWENQQSAALGDYLPKTVQITPKAPPEFEYRFITGKGETKKFEKGTNWLTWRGEVEEKGTFEVSVIYFPGWSAWVDGKEVEVDHDQELGTMIVSLDPGEHLVEFRFTNTPVRSWSNLISLLSWWSLLGFILFPKLWRLLIKK